MNRSVENSISFRKSHYHAVFLRVLKYAKPHTNLIIMAIIFSLCFSAFNALTLWFLKLLVDEAFVESNPYKVRLLPLAFIAAALVKGIFAVLEARCRIYLQRNVEFNIRNKLFDHIQNLPIDFFKNREIGSLVSLISHDVQSMQSVISTTFGTVIRNFFVIVGLTGFVFYLNWQLSLLSMVALPLILLPILKFGEKIRRYSLNELEGRSQLISFLYETLSNIKVVKAYRLQDLKYSDFETYNLRYVDNISKANIMMSYSMPISEIASGVGVAIVAVFGARQIAAGQLTTGSFVAFVPALLSLYRPIKSLAATRQNLQVGLTAADRVFSIFDHNADSRKVVNGGKDITNGIRVIDFLNVGFKYPTENRYIIRNLTVGFRKGELSAIIGPNGAGKTTICDMIPRFYDPSEGSIFVDGENTQNINLDSLRKHIGIVSQDPIFFNDTIEKNISLESSDFCREQIFKAAHNANAYDLIMNLPNGFDTVVGERGVKLSGGEKQRIALARALLRDPSVLILDEPTSSMDVQAEKFVSDTLHQISRERIVIVVAHRSATIESAEKKVVVGERREAEGL